MAVKSTNPMADLYRRLREVGLTRTKVRQFILPDWWEDQVADNPAGFAEGLSFISRHTGLDLASLREAGRQVNFRAAGPCKFKKSKNATEEHLALARSMATRVAQLVNAATVEPCLPLPTSGTQVRREILGQGHPWVSLANLVNYCWSVGIPVVHLTSIIKTKMPDGLAVKVRDRPIIVLCKQATFTAWLLFILAHELGHIALGHIPDDGVLIDEDVNANERDAEEVDANNFAIELLTGDKDCRFLASGRWLNATALARWARNMGRERQIDPGHIALNYAHSMGGEFFPVANGALAKLEPERGALGIVRRKLAEHLDWSNLPEDSSEFLMRVSQAETLGDISLGQRHRREAGDL
jgi:hypothetical protein